MSAAIRKAWCDECPLAGIATLDLDRETVRRRLHCLQERFLEACDGLKAPTSSTRPSFTLIQGGRGSMREILAALEALAERLEARNRIGEPLGPGLESLDEAATTGGARQALENLEARDA